MSENTNPRDRVLEYMDYATAHGIGRVKNSPFIILKVFWVLAVLGSVVVLSIQLTRLTEKWKSYPINTKIEIESQHEMRFPAVTVCNLNPLKYSHVQNDSILMSAVQMAAAKWGINLDEFEDDNNYNGTVHNTSEEFNQFNQIITEGRYSAEDVIEYFRIKASAESTDLIGYYSHQLSDLLVSCIFNGVPCDASYFERYRSYEFGMCNTFGLKTSNKTMEDGFRVFSPGKDYGLTMILNAEQHEYLPFITDSAGFVINIHSPDSLPYAREHDVIVSPGFNTEIAVAVEENDRIPGQTGRCDDRNTFSNLAECQKICLKIYIPEICGCTILANEFTDYEEYEYQSDDIAAEMDGDEPVRNCDPSKDTFCILQTKIAQGSGEIRCECLTPCRQTTYTTRVTSTRWPSERYGPVLGKILNQYSESVKYTKEDIRNNLAQVRIYLPSFSKQTLTEEQAYTDENFVSDIGGQLGLWIGFSVLSLGELIELIILVVGSYYQRNAGQPKIDKQPDKQPET